MRGYWVIIIPKTWGIHLRHARLIVIISASLLTRAATAFCGPIAFVGLAVPHLSKLFVNSVNHKILIPNVMMMGAILMLLCDTLSQFPGQTNVLPLNAMTAIFGAPVVIWVVLQRKIIRI